MLHRCGRARATPTEDDWYWPVLADMASQQGHSEAVRGAAIPSDVEAPIDEWDRMVAINVQGLLYVTHAALPHLARAAEDSPRRVADIVNISSTAGRVARPGSSVYNLTEFGVNAFTESLRQELLKRRVRISVVEPGTVDTELASHLRDDIRQAATSQIASIEPLQPEDIADAVAYIVTRDRRVAINEMLVRAGEQDW